MCLSWKSIGWRLGSCFPSWHVEHSCNCGLWPHISVFRELNTKLFLPWPTWPLLPLSSPIQDPCSFLEQYSKTHSLTECTFWIRVCCALKFTFGQAKTKTWILHMWWQLESASLSKDPPSWLPLSWHEQNVVELSVICWRICKEFITQSLTWLKIFSWFMESPSKSRWNYKNKQGHCVLSKHLMRQDDETTSFWLLSLMEKQIFNVIPQVSQLMWINIWWYSGNKCHEYKHVVNAYVKRNFSKSSNELCGLNLVLLTKRS